jgi:hypothetical protein
MEKYGRIFYGSLWLKKGPANDVYSATLTTYMHVWVIYGIYLAWKEGKFILKYENVSTNELYT